MSSHERLEESNNNFLDRNVGSSSEPVSVHELVVFLATSDNSYRAPEPPEAHRDYRLGNLLKAVSHDSLMESVVPDPFKEHVGEVFQYGIIRDFDEEISIVQDEKLAARIEATKLLE